MTKITVRDNGPLLVQGEEGEALTVCDATGAAFPVPGNPVVLCRCGSSAHKPFCDGTHRRVGFEAHGRAGGN